MHQKSKAMGSVCALCFVCGKNLDISLCANYFDYFLQIGNACLKLIYDDAQAHV